MSSYTTSYTNPTTPPTHTQHHHSSSLLNKLDPRVHSHNPSSHNPHNPSTGTGQTTTTTTTTSRRSDPLIDSAQDHHGRGTSTGGVGGHYRDQGYGVRRGEMRGAAPVQGGSSYSDGGYSGGERGYAGREPVRGETIRGGGYGNGGYDEGFESRGRTAPHRSGLLNRMDPRVERDGAGARGGRS